MTQRTSGAADRGRAAGRPARRSAKPLALALAVGLAVLAIPAGGAGQLLSPGPLTTPHADLEGLRNCTNCHELGRKGASASRCRSCHTVIDTRIKAERGYHASVKDQACSSCHKEHQGRDFSLVRLDTARFDHADTGYRLDGAHGDAGCRACHQAVRVNAPDVLAWGREHGSLGRTLLGLGRSCRGCHTDDDAHGSQFRGRECETCHATSSWERAERFDHDKAGYRLTGEHRQASCDGCHPREGAGETAIVKYGGVRVGNCSTCHEDNHKGAMGASCTTCHDPRGWKSLDRNAVASRFDHGRTKFPLRGRHAAADCAVCHARPRRREDPVHIRIVAGTERSSFPRPRAGSCAECHSDAHAGELSGRPDAGSCESCHGEEGWTPAGFGVERHNEETGFALTGAHVVTFCVDCHTARGTSPGSKLAFKVAAQDCASCHRKDDPHEGRFGERACEGCHVTEAFKAARFEHDSIAATPCRTCHEPDDPHAGQFGDTGCDRCHQTASFVIPAFDHGQTRFRLDGKHAAVACALCHTPEATNDGVAIVRYRPLRTECTACHGSVS